jgi:manganese transport protein
MTKEIKRQSLQEVNATVDTTGNKSRFKKFVAFLGPAYLVSVGYMDPGNWATDLAAGSKFGYALIWVLLMSNLMALLLQGLAARLGIVRKTDLAQANREYYPRKVNFVLYLLAEIAIAATDLAEVLGMAIGLHLLFDIPILWGVGITLLDTFLLLWLQRLGMRKMELFIVGLVFIIGLCFLLNLIMAKPELSELVKGFIPSFPDAAELYKEKGIKSALPTETALYLAIGIIGATIMPHNLYLHSALVQTRKFDSDEKGIRKAIKANMIDSAVALNLAFLVNAGILVLSAAVFFNTGRTEVGTIEEAHQLLDGMLGSEWAPRLFAIALIAAGQSSTVTGTLAGQIVMEGYLHLRLNPLLRRFLTRMVAVVPAVLVIYINGEENLDVLLILSQVILSMQLGFAIIPLIHFVSDKAAMGKFAISGKTKIAAWIVASILVYLNMQLLWDTIVGVYHDSSSGMVKSLVTAGGVGIAALLVYVVVFPLLSKRKTDTKGMHGRIPDLQLFKPHYSRVAIALDFGDMDEKVISHALMQGGMDTHYTLIHVLESAASKYLGDATADDESKEDANRMHDYVNQLKAKGYQVEGVLGYSNRIKDIISMVKESKADLVVMGSHGHHTFKDWLYGTTVDVVRHGLKIPVLVVK